MKEQVKYDPEDIESLLLHKEYRDLYPEEKDFVLKHLDGEDEYDSMRTMLITISSTEDPDEITPYNKTFDSLMEEFVTEEKRGFKWWLNSLFAGAFPKEKTWFRQPGFQMTLAMGMIVLGIIFVSKTNNSYENIAEAKTVSNNENSKPHVSNPKDGNQENRDMKNQKLEENTNGLKPNSSASKEKEPVVPIEITTTLECNDKVVSPISRNFTAEDIRANDPQLDNSADQASYPTVAVPTIAHNENDTKNIAGVVITKKELASDAPVPIMDVIDWSEDEETIESAEAEVVIATESTTKTTADTFDLDNSQGNSITTVSIQNIKTTSNEVSISTSKSLASNKDLIGLLYTAP